jgi:ABC-type transport system involved in multi-copper enzyme maturation permease subunit
MNPLKGTLRIARRELRAYLVAPWAYGVAVTFLVLTGTIFFVVADGSREASLRFWFPNLAFVLIVTVPIVTSRLVAEEWRSRHLDILLARPIAPAALVVGKWLAAVGFFVLLLAATLIYAVFLAKWGDPDWLPIVASYLGALLVVGVFCAVGTMTSAVTPTAVAAGLGAFAILVVGQLANNVPAFRGVSFQPYLESFARGAPGVEDAIYFASAMAAPLVVAAAWQTIRRRGASPLRGGKARAAALPAIVLAATLALNLIPIPATARVDLTASGRYTLSSESKTVLSNVKQKTVVTAFAPENSPQARDAEVLLAQFRRANPNIRTRVLDFAKAQGEALRLGAQDDGEVVVEIGERKEVVAPVIEQTISSALIRLVRRAPQTLCGLEGNGERRLDSEATQGLQLARLTAERNGIASRGLDLTVAGAIPADCTILVMAAPTVPLLANEIELINDWMAKDGKMLLLSEPGGPNLDAITTRWGLRLLPGVVFDPPRALAGDPTSLLVNDFPTESPVAADVPRAGFVTSGGITTAASEDAGLSVAKVLQSSDQSWLELNPAATPAAYEQDKGDRGGPVVLGGAADRSEAKPGGETRLPGDKPSIARTRLLAFADADWASNAYLENLSNDRLLINSFNWLASEEDLVAIPGDDPDLRRLNLTPSQRQAMGIGSIGAIPAAVLLAGAGVWLRRRRR